MLDLFLFFGFKSIVDFYDYIEVQPYSCYSYLLDTERVISEVRLKAILNDIISNFQWSY